MENEKKRLESGCGAVVQGMAGKKIFVELRDENYVIGILENCDSNLNLRLQNVQVIRNGQKTEENEYYVLGKYIRFIHFEHTIVPTANIRRCIKGVTDRRIKGNRKLDQKQFETSRKLID